MTQIATILYDLFTGQGSSNTDNEVSVTMPPPPKWGH